MKAPYEIMVLTVEEVLLDIYEGELGSKTTEEATLAFTRWITEHNAHYYTSKKTNGADAIMDAVLATINKGRTICVISECPPFDTQN